MRHGGEEGETAGKQDRHHSCTQARCNTLQPQSTMARMRLPWPAAAPALPPGPCPGLPLPLTTGRGHGGALTLPCALPGLPLTTGPACGTCACRGHITLHD